MFFKRKKNWDVKKSSDAAHWINLYEIFKRNFGEEKATEITNNIFEIINRHIVKYLGRKPRRQLESDMYEELIVYFENYLPDKKLLGNG